MSTHSTRRPRFLASVPASPQPAPLRFASAAPEAHHPRTTSAAAGPTPPAEATASRAGAESARRDALEKVAGAIATLRAQAAHLGEQARADAIEIGFLVARTMLQGEVRQDSRALFSLVRQAMRRAADSRTVTVRLSPEDAALVRAEAGALDGAAGAARVEIVADAALGRGDCLVDADFGRVDGRLETRLAELRRAIEADDAAQGDAA